MTTNVFWAMAAAVVATACATSVPVAQPTYPPREARDGGSHVRRQTPLVTPDPSDRRAPDPDPAGDKSSGAGPARGTRITLAQAVEEAARSAFGVLLAGVAYDAAAARARAALGDLLPEIAIGGSASRLDGRQVGSFGETRDVSFTRFEPSAGLFFAANPLAAGATLAAERHETRATDLERRDARRQAMVAAAASYLELARARASLRIAGELERDSRRLFDIATARRRANVGSGSDVARAKAELAAAEHAKIRAQAAWRLASIALATLLRRDTHVLLIAADDFTEPFSLELVPDAERARAAAERERPDVLAASERLRAARERHRAARWTIIAPQLEASVAERAIGTEDDALGETFLGRVGLRFSFGFADFARMSESDAQAFAAELGAREASERARAEVEAALVELHASASVVPQVRLQVQASRRAHAAALERFRAGLGLGIEVIDAGRAVARAELALANAILSYDGAQVRLLAAAGLLEPEAFAKRAAVTEVAN